ncbi:MAG: hypothetical protein CSA31_01700 [Desulfobulbus propionicus]|nr:MAG: hypothetical protein CSA31_01700 [Desulfobulbus propionicus]
MKRLTIVAILVVIAGVSYGVVSFFYDNVEKHLTSALPKKKAGVQQGNSLDAPVDSLDAAMASQGASGSREKGYGVIIRRNIFQAVPDGKEDIIEEWSSEDLEETALKLVLLGTVSTGSDQEARAVIIDEKTKKQDMYRVGDSLQGSAIKKILRGKVILEVNGNREVLIIKKREGGGPKLPGSGLARSVPARKQQIRPVKKKVPQLKPRRRISFRPSRAKQKEDIAEPEEPLGESEDDEGIIEEATEDELEPPDA